MTPGKLDDNLDSWYWPSWLSPDRADYYYHTLMSDIHWQTGIVRIFGKEHAIPRLQAWYGDAHCAYRYSGKTLQPLPWIPILTELRAELAAMGYAFNSVLLNLYRDGNDKMGWHADNEAELGVCPQIASISLGATRTFQFKHRLTKQRVDLQLAHGSLLMMQGNTQKEWLHQLPARKREYSARINLTFRNIRHFT